MNTTAEAIIADPQIVDLQRMANAIRFMSIDAIVRATEGHQGVPLGMAEIATALFTGTSSSIPPNRPGRTAIVSCCRTARLDAAVFAAYLTGYEAISLDQIKSFRELGSHCEGHPEFDPASGIEVTTGPLGQGIANAFGMAVAEAYLNARFGAGLVDHHTYAFVGDGCLQEGIGQEMISLAGHLRLSKLILFWDDNRITDDGARTVDQRERRRAFRVADGMSSKSTAMTSRRSRLRSRSAQGPATIDDRLPHGDCTRHRPTARAARWPQRAPASRRCAGRATVARDGRIRLSKYPTRAGCVARRRPPLPSPNASRGKNAWPHCRQQSAPSSNASPGELPAGWRDVLLELQAPHGEPGRAAGRHRDLRRRSTTCSRRSCPNAWSDVPIWKRPPATSAG